MITICPDYHPDHQDRKEDKVWYRDCCIYVTWFHKPYLPKAPKTPVISFYTDDALQFASSVEEAMVMIDEMIANETGDL